MLMKIFFILCFSLILSSCSHVSPKLNPEAAKINAKLGTAYLEQGDVVRAKNKLLLALEQNPNDAVVNTALGYFFAKTAEPQFAEKYYLVAIRLATAKGGVWNKYGEFLFKQQRYQEALSFFLLAAHDFYNTNIGVAYANASLAAKKLGQEQRAKIFWQKALANGYKNVSNELAKNRDFV
jgi:type IV pilus assembly protein PilF